MCWIFSKKEREQKRLRVELLNLDDEILDQKVKIQGTEFDRKRKLTQKELLSMQNDIMNGLSVKQASIKYNVSEWIVRYNTDSSFRAHQLKVREGKSKAHPQEMDFENRVAYKRALIQKKKINVVGI